jgi:hypothetical protein
MIHNARILTLAFLVASCSSGIEKFHKEINTPSGSAVHVAKWVFVGELERERQRVFVDVSSIRVAGDIRRAWIRWVFPPEPSARHQSYIMYGSAFNCVNGTNRDEAEIIYYSDGTNYRDVTYGEGIDWIVADDTSAKPWVSLPPGTPWSAAMKFVCDWRKANAAMEGKPRISKR